MAVGSFRKFIDEHIEKHERSAHDQPFSKTLEFNKDEVQVVVTITLPRVDQNEEAAAFLRTVADHLSYMARSSK
jgi:hypothetical protein